MASSQVDYDTQPLEALEAGSSDDFDEGTGSSFASSTQSITDSIQNYEYENGRRYQRYNSASYNLPNDETEQDRLDLAHHCQLLALDGKLHFAPLPETVHRVLDCGTGTGIWALDFGEVRPESEVIGVDLSPIQPSWVYPNVKFEVDDLSNQDWTWKEDYFDFIHVRQVLESIIDQDQFIKNMYKHTAPGGWVEISEWTHDVTCQDGTYTPDSAYYKVSQEFHRCAALAGQKIGTNLLNTVLASLSSAGFTDIQTHRIIIPVGTWPKDRRLREIGRTMGEIAKTGVEAYSLALLTKYGGYKEEEAKKMAREATREVEEKKIHVFYYQYQIIARKPVKEEA